MKQYRIEDIVNDVEVCMDEIADNDAEFDTNQDDTERTTIIESKIVEALRFILMNADWTFIEPNEEYTQSDIEFNDKNKNLLYAYMDMDTSFLRLVYAKFDSWYRYVSQQDLVFWDSKEYPMLKDQYCTGTAERPKVALVKTYSGNRLEFYCPSSKSDEFTMGIVTEPKAISGGQSGNFYNVPDKCCQALIYYIAGLVYVTYADQTRSNLMFTQANDLIGFTQQAAAATVPQTEQQ